MIFVIILALPAIAGCITVSKSAETGAVETPSGDLQTSPLPDPPLRSAVALGETKSTVRPAEPIAAGEGERFALRPLPVPETNGSGVLGTLFHERKSIYNQTSYAYAVEVAAPPCVIAFNVTPRSDDPRESYFVVSVRDGTGQERVKEGYGRIYSGNREQEIVIYGAGAYHLNIEGRRIAVDFRILTADAPPEETPAPPDEDAFEFWEYF
ncbi:hypothetical protein E2N92_12405 [Methanofollis formosanus]|uniref:Uncharacterized protein n=1 Tax=Methanofollis formosanus TaxID=299308 RepID=A0A8G1EGT8_9EURY|nr:hypothetical protein [Methanofollis formosanus]QYZ80173.1 hypothetical protein E2N92_12405 [Methanofollis formosanus]